MKTIVSCPCLATASAEAGAAASRPRPRGSNDLVTLTRSELDQQPGTPARALARRNPDLHFAFHNHEPGALVHLVVGQALADHEVEHDRARGIARGEDLRLPRLEIKRHEVPARPLRTPAHRNCPFVGRQCTGAVALGLIGPVPQLPSGSLHGRTGRWWTVAPAAGLSGAGCGLKRGAAGSRRASPCRRRDKRAGSRKLSSFSTGS
jgi:hypothetical protein